MKASSLATNLVTANLKRVHVVVFLSVGGGGGGGGGANVPLCSVCVVVIIYFVY